jgi:hypothetical protein
MTDNRAIARIARRNLKFERMMLPLLNARRKAQHEWLIRQTELSPDAVCGKAEGIDRNPHPMWRNRIAVHDDESR